MTSTTPVLGHSVGNQDLGDVYEVVVGGQGGRDIHVVLLDAAAPGADRLRRKVDAMVGHGPTYLSGGLLVWLVDPDRTPDRTSTHTPRYRGLVAAVRAPFRATIAGHSR
jgi:hypothetical protein